MDPTESKPRHTSRRSRFRFAQASASTRPEGINLAETRKTHHPKHTTQGQDITELIQAQLKDRPLVKQFYRMDPVPERLGRHNAFPDYPIAAVKAFDPPEYTGFPLQLRVPNLTQTPAPRAQYSIDSLLLTGAYSTEDNSYARFIMVHAVVPRREATDKLRDAILQAHFVLREHLNRPDLSALGLLPDMITLAEDYQPIDFIPHPMPEPTLPAELERQQYTRFAIVVPQDTPVALSLYRAVANQWRPEPHRVITDAASPPLLKLLQQQQTCFYRVPAQQAAGTARRSAISSTHFADRTEPEILTMVGRAMLMELADLLQDAQNQDALEAATHVEQLPPALQALLQFADVIQPVSGLQVVAGNRLLYNLPEALHTPLLNQTGAITYRLPNPYLAANEDHRHEPFDVTFFPADREAQGLDLSDALTTTILVQSSHRLPIPTALQNSWVQELASSLLNKGSSLTTSDPVILQMYADHFECQDPLSHLNAFPSGAKVIAHKSAAMPTSYVLSVSLQLYAAACVSTSQYKVNAGLFRKFRGRKEAVPIPVSVQPYYPSLLGGIHQQHPIFTSPPAVDLPKLAWRKGKVILAQPAPNRPPLPTIQDCWAWSLYIHSNQPVLEDLEAHLQRRSNAPERPVSPISDAQNNLSPVPIPPVAKAPVPQAWQGESSGSFAPEQPILPDEKGKAAAFTAPSFLNPAAQDTGPLPMEQDEPPQDTDSQQQQQPSAADTTQQPSTEEQLQDYVRLLHQAVDTIGAAASHCRKTHNTLAKALPLDSSALPADAYTYIQSKLTWINGVAQQLKTGHKQAEKAILTAPTTIDEAHQLLELWSDKASTAEQILAKAKKKHSEAVARLQDATPPKEPKRALNTPGSHEHRQAKKSLQTQQQPPVNSPADGDKTPSEHTPRTQEYLRETQMEEQELDLADMTSTDATQQDLYDRFVDAQLTAAGSATHIAEDEGLEDYDDLELSDS